MERFRSADSNSLNELLAIIDFHRETDLTVSWKDGLERVSELSHFSTSLFSNSSLQDDDASVPPPLPAAEHALRPDDLLGQVRHRLLRRRGLPRRLIRTQRVLLCDCGR